MKFLRSLDLYKAIVLLSLVLLPLGGFWIKTLDDTIAASKLAIEEARRPGGVLEQIGALQRKVEVVVQNKRSTSDAIKDPRRYFEGQILAAAAKGSLKSSEFSPEPPRDEHGTLPPKQHFTDYVVDVEWPQKDQTFAMDFVFAVLFNCESGASAIGEQGQQSVWKLRALQLVNATDERGFGAAKPPPPELLDKWSIKDMKFARREPRKGTGS